MGESSDVRLARIEEMLKAHCEDQGRQLKVLFGNVDELNKRLTDVEHWRAETKGGWAILAALTAGGGAVGAFISKLSALLGS